MWRNIYLILFNVNTCTVTVVSFHVILHFLHTILVCSVIMQWISHSLSLHFITSLQVSLLPLSTVYCSSAAYFGPGCRLGHLSLSGHTDTNGPKMEDMYKDKHNLSYTFIYCCMSMIFLSCMLMFILFMLHLLSFHSILPEFLIYSMQSVKPQLPHWKRKVEKEE